MLSIKKGKQKIIIILGPTASGKSDLAVRLAKKFNGEIISADSRQVYRGMNIGTGKITKREMRGVRHHLLDVANPKRRFHAKKYRILAQTAIDEIVSRGKLPIICGGTGFYIDAVLSDNPFPNVPPNTKLRKKLSKKSPAQLLLILKKLDQKRAKAILESNSERKNARRIIRAIEIALNGKKELVGRPHPSRHARESHLRDRRPGTSNHDQYSTFFIGIKPDRDELRERINSRLLKRLEQGMVHEARQLHRNGLSWKRMDELGLEYRYLAKYLQGKMSREEMVKKLNTEIWHYARRQKTWWRKDARVKWLRPEEVDKMEKAVAACN